jgi:type I restriction enzyme S subunit
MRTKNVQEDLDESDIAWIPASIIRNSSKYLNPGDILVSSANSWNLVGKGCWVPELKYPASAGGFISILRGNPDTVDLRYLYHWFISPQTQAKLRSYSNKTTNISNLDHSRTLATEIPLPPLEEQRRIAAILDKAASLEAAQRRRTQLLWGIEASLFCQMSEQTACESKKCTLQDLTADGDKINYGVVQPGNHVDGGIPLIRVGDLMSGGVNRSDLKCIDPEIESAYARSRIKGNELLLSCVGSIGTVAEAGPADIGSNIARAVARIPVSEAVNRKWLAACLRSSAIQRYFTNELRTVSQPTLNIKQIEETTINLFPIELQNTFASKLHAIEKVCRRSSFSEVQTRQMISALQSRAFSDLLQLQ